MLSLRVLSVSYTPLDVYQRQVIQNIENGKNTFDVSNLASGNYLLEITNAEGKAVYKFTKQ